MTTTDPTMPKRMTVSAAREWVERGRTIYISWGILPHSHIVKRIIEAGDGYFVKSVCGDTYNHPILVNKLRYRSIADSICHSCEELAAFDEGESPGPTTAKPAAVPYAEAPLTVNDIGKTITIYFYRPAPNVLTYDASMDSDSWRQYAETGEVASFFHVYEPFTTPRSEVPSPESSEGSISHLAITLTSGETISAESANYPRILRHDTEPQNGAKP